MNWNWMRLFGIMAIIFAFLLAQDSFAQYDKISHNTRSLELGGSGVDDTAALNATVVIPVAGEKFTGWVGFHTNQLAVEGKIQEQIINGHLQGGTQVGEVGLKVFFTAERDKMAGVGLNTQIGIFGDYDINENLKVGAGNLFEREVAEKIHVGDDEDVTLTPRLLAFLAGEYGAWSALLKTTPQWKLEDFEATVELTYEYPVSEKVNAEVGVQLEYKSDPIIEDKNLRRSYTAQIAIEF